MHKVRLEQEFMHIVQKNSWWQAKDRLLLAISGGVDSMVLLHLLIKCFPQQEIGVVHLNHQLRVQANDEAAYLSAFCQARRIPFYEKSWQNPPTQGIEAAARQFRYAFFAEVMQKNAYDALLTAHHGDDQIETILMKLMRHGNLGNVIGIREQTTFDKAQLTIVRPLLSFAKAQLYTYAKSQKLHYFEDESNQTTLYQRNRLRQSVLPIIQTEQPEASRHFLRFSKQLSYAEEILLKQQKNWYAKMVTLADERVDIDWRALASLTEGERYFFWQYTFQQLRLNQHIRLKDRHIEQLEQLFSQGKSNWSIDVEANWRWVKSPTQLSLQKVCDNETPMLVDEASLSFQLTSNQAFYLNDKQWIGLFTQANINLPEKVKNWSEFRHEFMADSTLCLNIRKRQAGDRIRLNQQLTKRLSRWLIDQKISSEQRNSAWVVENQVKEIYSLLPFVNSYLSIGSETDKIRYILVYRYLA